MRNCMKLQNSFTKSNHISTPWFSRIPMTVLQLSVWKVHVAPTRSKDPGTTNVSEKSSVTFGWGLEGCNHSGDALRLILYTYRYRTPSQWMNCKFAVPKLPTQSNPWSQRQAMNGNLSHWVFLTKRPSDKNSHLLVLPWINGSGIHLWHLSCKDLICQTNWPTHALLILTCRFAKLRSGIGAQG